MIENRGQIHKGNWLKTIFDHGKWYMLSSLFTKGINIFVLRVYTEYLSPKDYGILDTLNAIALLLPFFISLYLDSAFSRYFHEYKHDKEKLRQLFSTLFIFVSFFGSFMVIIFLLISPIWIKDLLAVPFYPHILLTFIPPLFFQLGNLGLIFLRQSLFSKQTMLVEISTVLINVGVALPLLILADYGLVAKLLGNFSTSICLFLFYVVYFIKNGMLRLTFNFSILKESLSYSVPLFPVFAGAWIAGLSDRLVIANYQSLEAVGLYSVGFMIGKLLYVFQDAITQVTGPITMSGLVADKDKTKIKIAKTSLYIWTVMIFLNFGLYFFSKELVAIFADEAYSKAYYIIPVVGFSYVLGSQQRIFATVIGYYKKNWVLSIGGIFQAILNLGLNIYFVPKFGIIAAAWSTIITMFLYATWLYLWAQYYEKIPYYLMGYLSTLTFILLVGLCLSYFSLTSIVLRAIIFLMSGIFLFAGFKLFKI